MKKIIYHYSSSTNRYIGTGKAFDNEMPKYCTLIKPPEYAEEEIPLWENGEWIIIDRQTDAEKKAEYVDALKATLKVTDDQVHQSPDTIIELLLAKGVLDESDLDSTLLSRLGIRKSLREQIRTL